jgi:hypothetical protein
MGEMARTGMTVHGGHWGKIAGREGQEGTEMPLAIFLSTTDCIYDIP